MSVNFPGNPIADAVSSVDENTAGVMTSLNLLAYEQRTATLVNLLGVLTEANRPIPNGLYTQIVNRLGIGSSDH